MSEPQLIKSLFQSDVTRDIPPVVYFHEQNPVKLADEVGEYIITGGWPESHPNHKRVPDGIHEQYVRLLNGIASELDKSGGPDLPNAWISGFYGSGKSSFAKLLGLALDGVALPSGGSMADALLKRDTSPQAEELRTAWNNLRQKISDPFSVVFDVGGFARDNEQIHSAVVRQVQKKLGYCSKDPIVADHELKLERDGEWDRFQSVAQETLKRPWDEVKDNSLAGEDFSLVLSTMFPDHYSDPMAWYMSRAGTHQASAAPRDAVHAIRDMMVGRRKGSTLFIVVDEVSQYVVASKDRVDRLRAFASELGSELKGSAWLLALGQQKVDEEMDDSWLSWAKDRFPQKLRVHLAPTNIRDVVHKRLLQKTKEGEALLKGLFDRHRPDLKLYAYGCENVSADEFVEVYPMLPGQIDLLLQITTALRTRSARAQGDDQAIRGLLQLLGELFRSQKLAEQPVGHLVTLDRIYEVQHTALDSDVQQSMARIIHECANDTSDLRVRAAKAVALLELIQDTQATDAKLVAQCLFERVDSGNQSAAITEALESLRRDNLLAFSEKEGYRIQSTAGEEWERDRRDIGVGRESISATIQDALKLLMGGSGMDKPKFQGRHFPWSAKFSDGRRASDETITDPRDAAAVQIDFRFVPTSEQAESNWIKQSEENALQNRVVWVCGDTDQMEQIARQLLQSKRMIEKFEPRKESLTPARKLLLQQENNRKEELQEQIRQTVTGAWLSGRMYFRSKPFTPQDFGTTFTTALQAAATRVLPDLFPSFEPTSVQPSELLQLIEPELSAPTPKFIDPLGILELDGGRYVPSCHGGVPQRVLESIKGEGGISGVGLLKAFEGPPYGYTTDLVRACVAGLLRGGQLRIQPEGGPEITATRDAGVRDLFDKDRPFKRANFFPAGDDDVGKKTINRICRFFADTLHHEMDREPVAIADAVATHFVPQAERLREVLSRLNRLPGSPELPKELDQLTDALGDCVKACRQTKPTVLMVRKHLDALSDGIKMLNLFDAELTEDAIDAVEKAGSAQKYQITQLCETGVLATDDPTVELIHSHLASDRTWQDIGGLDDDLEKVRESYVAERQRLLTWQETLADEARSRLRTRPGFSTLTAEQSHRVLRPISQAPTNTTPEAIAPALSALKDTFEIQLQRAEDEANELLDEIRSEVETTPMRKVPLNLHNREVETEADVDALVGEIRERLMEYVKAGERVRIQ